MRASPLQEADPDSLDAGGTLLDAVASLRPLVDPKRRVLGDYT